ncbi:MAG TPA: hypothetical protein ENN90_13835 [Mariniphaga anaerophila]|uniref:Right handed beta helix region n=1 Tax=Mariniphaga anaerophila TaxID=1484053 RepID=A0A831LWV7_9BACT|nr:hypothetical protein [Mariniphaga anaerophila]
MPKTSFFLFFFLLIINGIAQQTWQSKFVKTDENGKLVYVPDERGNIIPDFSQVGFASGEIEIPDVPVVETLEPVPGDNLERIQQAIDRIAKLQLDVNGFRGALLLKKGTYNVNETIYVRHSGIVIRGEGTGSEGTLIREVANEKCDLFRFAGKGSVKRQESTMVEITENFVPVGRKYFEVTNTSDFKVGDSVLVYRPGTDKWIHDLKMDQIVERENTQQWKSDTYHFYFERIIEAIEGNKVYFDNPVVMEMEKKYGGGYLMKYSTSGRIKHCGIENLQMESTFKHETDEEHGWFATSFSDVSQSWVRNVIAKYFGQGCVKLDRGCRNISVVDSKSLEAKSEITGGRRYSFANDGQMNLFKNCYSTYGRHDYVTGSRVCGPNVYTNCTSRNAQSDIGPHQRWAMGTLYDKIDTDGQINVQDRGRMGSGHGWAGVTQVLWNCRSPKTAVQSPWVSGKNYCIGLIGGKYPGHFDDRPDGEWEGYNKQGLIPESLYEAQLKDRLHKLNQNKN